MFTVGKDVPRPQHVWFTENGPLTVRRACDMPKRTIIVLIIYAAWKDYFQMVKDYLRIGKTIYSFKNAISGLRLFLQNS